MCESYYLNVLHENNNFKLIRELTNDEKETFFKAQTLMHKLNVKLTFFRIIDHDYNELKNFEKEYNKQINYFPVSIDGNYLLFEFTRLIHNYLSSVNLFLNQYDANVKRDYEKEFFEEYNELKKDLHAENLSYRIIYEFQNEIRHSRIPSLTIESERKGFLEPLEAKFYIQKDYLNINKLKKDEEFQNLDDLIDIYEHMENMNSYLFELASIILKFELNLHDEYYDFLKGLVGEIEVDGRPCVMNYKEFDENSIKPSISFIDKRFIELIDKVKKYKDMI